MGWRFRRGIRVLPGVRLNVSKRGISSVSIGRRGLTLNVSRRGTKETIGLPGTGISYTTPVQRPTVTYAKTTAIEPVSSEAQHTEVRVIGWIAVAAVAVLVVALVALLAR